LSLFLSLLFGAKKERKSDGKREKSRAYLEVVKDFSAQILGTRPINLHLKI